MSYPYVYANVEDVQSRYDSGFIDRICLDSATDSPVYDRLQDALDDATGEIDSYLSTVYQLPIVPVPALLKRMCMDMACYHAAITADRVTEQLEMRYKGWISHLKDIANRKAGLGIPIGQPTGDGTATEPTEGTGAGAASSGRTIRV